jgi:hypothetical protein
MTLAGAEPDGTGGTVPGPQPLESSGAGKRFQDLDLGFARREDPHHAPEEDLGVPILASLQTRDEEAGACAFAGEK